MNKSLIPLLAAGVIGCNSGNSIPPASQANVSAGLGYVHLTTSPDKAYGFDGQLNGWKLFVSHHLNQNLYLGGEVMAYQNANNASNTEETPKGTNEYALRTLGIGTGVVGGYQYENNENLGVGIESQLGLMVDTVEREKQWSRWKESKSQSLPYGYLGFGVRLKVFSLCVIPSAGFRTYLSEVSEVFPMGSVSVGYCPNLR